MQYGESDMERPHNSYGESLNLLFYMGSVCCKYCQRHNGPKTLSTLTHSTPLVQVQVQLKSWLCLEEGKKYSKILRTNNIKGCFVGGKATSEGQLLDH